ncbi:MAG: phosphate signaling complex protein PhoU [Lachnospiraceae bacterium]|nr:phosphate signaling complex protein PhoU [Bacillota bacterium]MDD7252764.1 phosphate signaling complex protein PhoU [Bacillota bacterium]MDY2948804.1 phosphate signaling complex protein PhoU [Lachnospiraceae bacterium]
MRNRFDAQLLQLNRMLIHMGDLCGIAIENATKALQDGNIQMAYDVMTADAEIDQAERDIERLCLTLLLQQQPVARDLRQISSALKMITDMERIGDQASDIAEIVVSAQLSEATDFPKIVEMSVEVTHMVEDSIKAFVDKNLELAGNVEARDDVVDMMFDSVKNQLIDYIGENQGQAAHKAIDLVMISKYLERIGDHATNIAEWVTFSITGVHEAKLDTKKITG